MYNYLTFTNKTLLTKEEVVNKIASEIIPSQRATWKVILSAQLGSLTIGGTYVDSRHRVERVDDTHYRFVK